VDTESRLRPSRANVRRPAWPSTAGRRRPSGLDQPFRRPVRRSTWVAVGVFLVSAVMLAILRAATGPGGGIPLLHHVDRFDRAVAGVLGEGRASRVAAEQLRGLDVLGYRVLWIPGAVVLTWFARWRALAVYLGTVSLVAAVAQAWAGEDRLSRAVRLGVIGSEDAVVLPAWPVVVVSAILTATLFALVPGPRRRWGWAAAGTGIAMLCAVRVAVGLDSASATLASAGIGVSAVVLGFTVFAPESDCPVTYRRDVHAHLRLDGPRRERVLDAVRDQLGVEVIDLEPYRLDGSAGSTPCRLTVAGGQPDALFGKLYATTHLRSDRWYKLARVLRYGRLEDEAPFSSVRRLAEHEDYMLRLLRDGGVRVPEPWGVAEVIPGREYLLVSEFVPDAVEILESGVPEAVLDDALEQVRGLWRAGAAHRDIKPSNVLARAGHVYIVDVSFGELRPSRWRQAVDLANMMLTVGLVAGPRLVVERALHHFDREELAEAFAATSSVTVPRQLRRLIDASGADLVAEFRALLPPHERIRVQRWSLRRVLLAVGTAGGLLAVTTLIALNLTAGGLL
jgi:tRNA A-37 threonylcarbamoyl transferase component Bud32